MRLLYGLIRITALILIFSDIVYCDEVKYSTPILPILRPKPEEMGLLIGLGPNSQSGSFYTDCPCEFIDGIGTNYLIGLFYEKEILDDLRIGASGFLDFRTLESSYREKETIEVYSSSGVYVADANIMSKHTGAIGAASIGGMPYLKWYFGDVVFLKAGFYASYMLSANIKHTQQFLQSSVKLSNGEIGVLKDINGGIITNAPITLEDRSYEDISPFQYGIAPMLGFDIQLSRAIALTPIFQYNIPLSKISETGAGLTINSWSVVFELRHTLIKISDESDQPE